MAPLSYYPATFGHYGACPPTVLHMPGHVRQEGTVLPPIDELDESSTNGGGAPRDPQDSVMGIPCDLLPDPFRQEFLPDDIIFFRRSSSNTEEFYQASISRGFQAHFWIRLATWVNFCTCVILIAFLSACYSLGHNALTSKTLGIHGLFAICLALRLTALVSTLLLLVHHRVDGLRTRNGYDELFTLSPVGYYLILPRYRRKVGAAIMDLFSFIDSTACNALHNLSPRNIRLPGTPGYGPLSSYERQQSLNNGWLILHLGRYPNFSGVFLFRPLINALYHLWQDWRRYQASVVVYQTLEQLGAIESGIAVLNYSVSRIEREARGPYFAYAGFHFIPKYVGRVTELDMV